MASYSKKEISEWNTTDLCNWLIDNKYPGISELFQNNSISGYDLFFINDDILKKEFGLNSFHERRITMKLINKLIYEHLKLNIINYNGDNVILTLDNNLNTSLGELSEYIGGMFNIDPKNILYKDNSKTEVLSPSLKIIQLLILYPRLYKTLNIFNMKDYHQISENENENLESKTNNYNTNLNSHSAADGDAAGSENESEFQKSNINNNMNKKRYFDNKRDNIITQKEIISKENYDNIEDNQIIYNENPKNKNNQIIYNDDFDIQTKKYKNEINYQRNRNENSQNTDEINNDIEDNNWAVDNNDLKYRNKTNYRDNSNSNSNIDPDYSYVKNRKKMNYNDNHFNENYRNNKSYKNLDNRNNYYNNELD